MKVYHSADCQLDAQLWKLLQHWELTTQDVLYTFARDLAKHALLGLDYLVSLLLEREALSPIS